MRPALPDLLVSLCGVALHSMKRTGPVSGRM